MPQIIRKPSQVGSVGKSQRQVAHGFAVGDQIHVDNTGTWLLSQANSPDTLKQGMVRSVEDADNFTVIAYGVMTWTAHGFTVGEVYYLSAATAGDVVLTAPSSTGEYIQAVFSVLDADTIKVYDANAFAAGGSISGNQVVSVEQAVSAPITLNQWVELAGPFVATMAANFQLVYTIAGNRQQSLTIAADTHWDEGDLNVIAESSSNPTFGKFELRRYNSDNRVYLLAQPRLTTTVIDINGRVAFVESGGTRGDAELSTTLPAAEAGLTLAVDDLKQNTQRGYRELWTGMTVGEYTHLCSVQRFFMGTLYLATSQNTNAPQLKIEISHPFNVSTSMVNVTNCNNNDDGGLPWDQVVLIAATNGGGDAEVWLRWGSVVADAEVEFRWVGAGNTSDSFYNPVSWPDTPVHTLFPGTIRKTVNIQVDGEIIFDYPLQIPAPQEPNHAARLVDIDSNTPGLLSFATGNAGLGTVNVGDRIRIATLGAASCGTCYVVFRQSANNYGMMQFDFGNTDRATGNTTAYINWVRRNGVGRYNRIQMVDENNDFHIELICSTAYNNQHWATTVVSAQNGGASSFVFEPPVRATTGTVRAFDDFA